jgi:hypothetical protein
MLNTSVPTETLICMLTAVSCRISKTWKQPRAPSVDEQIPKVRFIQTGEY